MFSLTTKMNAQTGATNSYTASVAGLIKRDPRLALKIIAHSCGIIGVSSYGFNSAVKTMKARKAAKIRNRYNQVPHVTQDTTWKSDKSAIEITNKISKGAKIRNRYNQVPHLTQEVSPFPAGYHKTAMNRRESITNTNINNTNDPHRKYRL